MPWAASCSSALDYAHSRCAADGQPLHRCHRDVSPANILLSTEAVKRFSDFGIAQASATLESASGIRLRGEDRLHVPGAGAGRDSR